MTLQSLFQMDVNNSERLIWGDEIICERSATTCGPSEDGVEYKEIFDLAVERQISPREAVQIQVSIVKERQQEKEIERVEKLNKGRWLEAEAYKVSAAIVRGDKEELKHFLEVYHQMSAQQRPSSLPLDPFEDDAVCYGVILALIEFSDAGANVIVSPKLVGILMGDENGRQRLKSIVDNPVSITNNTPSGEPDELKCYLELGLLEWRQVDRQGKLYALEVTREGYAVLGECARFDTREP